MKSLYSRLATAGLFLFAPVALFSSPFVGDIFFVSATNGTTQFFLDNFTGATDGCSTPAGFPVCTSLTFTGTLTYSYSNGSGTVNGSAALGAPIGPNSENGGAAYAPLNFALPTTNILSASFAGFLLPASFVTDAGPFSSNGLITSGDLVAGQGFALLSTDVVSSVPEPGTALMLALAGLGFAIRAHQERRTWHA